MTLGAFHEFGGLHFHDHRAAPPYPGFRVTVLLYAHFNPILSGLFLFRHTALSVLSASSALILRFDQIPQNLQPWIYAVCEAITFAFIQIFAT